ncbi:MAG: pectin acetylesterase-family hydrolase, partial [Myxococcota bacterium]
MSGIRRAAFLLTLLLPVACGDDGAGDPTSACAAAVPEALRSCLGDYGRGIARCYSEDGGPCAEGDASLAAALADIEAAVTASCGDGELFGLSASAVVGRVQNACSSEASSAAWRAYGGPQGAAWASADVTGRACLSAVHNASIAQLDADVTALAACAAGDGCEGLANARRANANVAEAAIGGACRFLDDLAAVTPDVVAERVALQADCATAAAIDDTAGLGLECGPSHAQFDAPDGEWTFVPVDGDQWGTACGDGSPYGFFVRFPNAGGRLDRLVIALQGGGVCLFEGDCRARFEGEARGLFRADAEEDAPLGGGIGSDDPNVNPFAEWTRVYLPYCNQDVFAGGGEDEVFGDLTVKRFGAVNLRSALRMVRDVLWQKLDDAGGAGFRPDELVAFFGGFSAGGYGTLYNYHWMLDDLQWPRTIAFPDAGLGPDNGMVEGVAAVGVVKLPLWGTRKNLPPYCFTPDCAVGPVAFEALSPRLLQVPEQQVLFLSNQFDATASGDAFFETPGDY